MQGVEMHRTIHSLIFVLTLFPSGECIFGGNYWRFMELLEKHLMHVAEQNQKYFAPVETAYIKQPLDHFDALSQNETFNQRLFINENYWSNPDGPVFLMIVGEGTMSKMIITSGHCVELAEKYKALVIAVEHRFYGDSINDNGLLLDSLRHLSSQQALADLEGVYRYITVRYNLTKNNTWVSFGGSYAGNLAAWFRIKYPHIVYGAVASSAPVRAIKDYQGFNEVVARSIANDSIGGNLECETQINQAFIQIDALIKLGNFELLENMYHSCGSIKDPLDSLTFAMNLEDIVTTIVQYNKLLPNWDISNLCGIMAISSDPLRNLAYVNEAFMKKTNMSCVNNTYAESMKNLLNTTVDRTLDVRKIGIRAWSWQKCSQFGYFQTCSASTTCPYSKMNTLSSRMSMCKDVFEIPLDMVDKFINFTNNYYGSDQPKASRIIFPNGSNDPWHLLGVLNDLSDTIKAVLINGGSHCNDMNPSRDSDSQALKDARKKIDSLLGSWLDNAKQETMKNVFYLNL